MKGTDLPKLRTAVPGPRSRAQIDVLARHECPAITARRARRAEALGLADDDPIVWAEALGANVADVDGNVFVDLCAGFGAALVGHRDPAVLAAVAAQQARLVHAMGDAWPDDTRIRLLEKLAAIAPAGLTHSILGLSGSDAVDAAVKTALLATGRATTLVFEGGYHGLALGVVGYQAYNPSFNAPFRELANPPVRRVGWGCPIEHVRMALSDGKVGLVLVEPVQGRGGMRTAPDGWHAEVAEVARKAGALVAHDEIFSGIGRTGTRFAGVAEGVVPDLLCVGKALGGGFPVSACLGTKAVMDAWGASKGASLHTQTFLGHPVGCAAALAVLDRVDDVAKRAATVGTRLADGLRARGYDVSGRGAMLGVRCDALKASRALLREGFLTLPAGMQAEVLGITPPVCLTDAQADAFLDALAAKAPPH